MSPDLPSGGEAATARAVIDESGVLVDWNEGARRLLGYTPEEVEGRPVADLLVLGGAGHPPRPSGDRWSGTLELRHRDGRTLSVWLLAHHRQRAPANGAGDWLLVTPLGGPGPRPQNDPLMRSALTMSPCATAVYDTDLRLHGVNDAMADTIGLPEDRVRGLRLSEIGGKPENEELERHLREVLASGERRDVQTYLRSGGEERAHAWLARLAPLTDDAGRVHGACVTAHDFSDQYLARERLQLVNEASVRIGSTLDVTRTAQELADVCVPALADFVSVDLLDPSQDGAEP